MKRYKAIMHFSKPGSTKGTPWTVHFRGTCHIVESIDCRVRMHSEFNSK